MKHTLLTSPSNFFRSFNPKSFGFLLALYAVLTFSSATSVQAQCTGYFYQAFESFKSTTYSPAPTATAPGALVTYTQGVTGTDYWRGFGLTVLTTSGYSGGNSVLMSTAAGYLITPKINSAGTVNLSFYHRITATGSATLSVEYSTDYAGGGADPAGATWLPVGTGSVTSTSNVWNAANVFSGSFTPGGTGAYVRIKRTSVTAQVPSIDDLAWSSSVANENLVVVVPNSTATNSCASITLDASKTYTFYDNGGDSDRYNLSQNSTVQFIPPAGYNIVATVNYVTVTSDATCADTDWVKVWDGTTSGTLLNWIQTGCVSRPAPGANLTSTAPDGSLSFQFKSDASAVTAVAPGYSVTINMIASGCPDLTSPLVSLPTYNSAQLSWTAPGTTPSGGYDYYVSTTGGTPPSGALTPSSTTSLQAANVPSGVTVSVTGLSSSTTYYGWVRSNCGGAYGTWLPISGSTFATLCAPTAVPPTYTENFEGSLVLPTCTSTTSASYGIATASSNNYFFNTTAGTYFFSKPLLLDPTKIYKLSFDYSSSTNQSTTIKSYYGKTDYAVSAVNVASLLGTVTTTTSTVANARYYFQPNSATTPYYIGLQLSAITGGALILDNVKLEVVPCFPAATPVVVGSAISCPSTSLTYTATANGSAGTTTADGVNGVTTTATGMIWTVPAGWVISSGQGTNTLVAISAVGTGVFITATGTISGCDNSVTTNKAVASYAIPPQPGAITGTTTMCSLPAAGLVYSIAAVSGATSYVWTFPAGWTVTAGGTTNSVTVTATAGAASGTITVTPKNLTGCSGTPQTLSVVVGAVNNSVCASAIPITTSINDVVRCSATEYFYSFTPVCSGSHKITLTGSANDLDLFYYGTCGGPSLGSSTSFTSSETITANLTAGVPIYIRVLLYSGSGQSFTVAVASTAVGTPAAISGSGSVSCSSSTTTSYSIAAVSGASTYTWTVPAGWTIDSGQGTTSITITTGGTTGGTISVIASGVCGTSLPTTKTITVGQLGADSISGTTALCASVANTTYSITPVTGATGYTWAFPSGWNVVSGAGTTSVTVTPSTTSGNVSVVVAGPCGDSPATTLAVTTASAVTSTGASVCVGGSGTMSSTLSALNSFAIADIPVGAPTFVRSTTGTTYTASQTVIYTTQTIIPTVTGAYTFTGCDTSGRDTFIHIYDGSFNPASPATNFMAADDDAGSAGSCNLDPLVSVTLTAGQPYVIVYCVYSSATTSVSGITVTVTPPAGGGVQLGQIEWYTAASGGTLIGTGSPFNPVGAAGSGLADTNTSGTTVFYGTNSLTSYCRTPTNFVVNVKPTVTLGTASMSVCGNSYIPLTVSGTANTYTWTATVANTIYSNTSGTLYVPGANATTVYIKASTTDTITVTGTNTASGCTDTASVTFTIVTKVWSGSWTPAGTPVSTDTVVINTNYSGGGFSGCTCKVNAGTVVFNTGETLSLTNELTVSGGSVTFNDGASLVQTNNVTNVGNITYVRNSQPCYKYDYTYWSTPVTSTTLGAVSPITSWDGFFAYNPAITNWQLMPSTTTMGIGKGYIIRVPDVGFNPSPGVPLNHTLNFIGVPNNGTYTTPIAGGANELNLIGNPYPSAISAASFVTDVANSSVVDATLYFWTHNTPMSGGIYTSNDYAVWNILGGVATHPATNSGVNNTTPNGYINSGQGFFIKGLSAGNATFKNSMRVSGNNSQFFKSATASAASTSAPASSRIWLDILNPEAQAFKEMLVGYVEGGTSGMDRGFDSEMVDIGNTIALYTMVADKKLTIQGVGLPFTESDMIPLGFKSTVDGTQTISLANVDGLFENQALYLEDKTLNIIQDLKQGNYTFTSLAGTFEDRFVLRFTNTALGVPTFSEGSVVVYKNLDGIHINSGVTQMKKVVIFDVTGRVIASRSNLNSNETLFTNITASSQLLLVQITSEDGVTITKKIMN